jgi:hypothetical protein
VSKRKEERERRRAIVLFVDFLAQPTLPFVMAHYTVIQIFDLTILVFPRSEAEPLSIGKESETSCMLSQVGIV